MVEKIHHPTSNGKIFFIKIGQKKNFYLYNSNKLFTTVSVFLHHSSLRCRFSPAKLWIPEMGGFDFLTTKFLYAYSFLGLLQESLSTTKGNC